MNTTDLYTFFRQEVVDLAKPYLWSDSEVFSYMDEAQMMFARLGVGISDVTTEEVVRVPITAGEEYSPLHESVLHVRAARLASTGKDLGLKNLFDADKGSDDYGQTFSASLDHRPGPVRAMVLGEQENLCRWVGIPQQDDEAILSVYRLPLVPLTGKDQPLEIRREHHRSLLMWMKHLAYGKQDAETFDKSRADNFGAEFQGYCDLVKAEWERYKHKPRLIAYGGL